METATAFYLSEVENIRPVIGRASEQIGERISRYPQVCPCLNSPSGERDGG